jgi:hypothetical protein
LGKYLERRKKCPFLVRYGEIFSEVDSELAVMEPFPSGELQQQVV